MRSGSSSWTKTANAGTVSTYYCENCGALMKVGGPEGSMLLFHVPRGSISTEQRCLRGSGPSQDKTLKTKLQKLDEESMGHLRRI